MMRYAFKTAMFVAIAAFSLAGCDQAQNIANSLANAGSSGPNPGVGGSGGGGNGGGGGGGGGGSAGVCPTGTLAVTVGVEVHCRLTGTITADVTLTAINIYQLDGAVFVGEDVGPGASKGDPATLTIQAGTRIYGRSPNSFLVISRGSRIQASGTQTNPIIFTSAQDLGYADELGLPTRPIWTGNALLDPNTGEWGGLILNGRSQCNCTSDLEGPGTGEGEVGSGQYGGGSVPLLTDNSGTLRYVQIKYAGFLVNAEQELNGIAFQGVGSGTTVDHVQIYNGQDDGMEFFGGTVNVKFIVLNGSSDDGFDWTEGWSGKAQFVLIMQNPFTEASDDPRGIEADNNGSDNNALPRSMPILSNFTLIGPSGDSSWPGNNGVLLRRGTAGHLMNIVVSDFEGVSLDVDDAATYAQWTGGGLILESFLAGSNSQKGTFATDSDDGPLAGLFDSGGVTNNLISAPSLSGYVNGAVEMGMTAKNPSTVDPFFSSVNFVGAVNSP